MLGFYICFYEKTRLAAKIIKTSYDNYNKHELPKENSLVIFDDSNMSQLIKLNNECYYLLGTMIYNNRCGIDALKLVINSMHEEKKLEDIAKMTRGQFCLIIKRKNKIYIVTDRIASFPIYRIENNKCIQITNILPLLLKKNNISFNRQGIVEYLSFNYTLSSTLFNEIDVLEMSKIYCYGFHKSDINYDYPFKNISYEKYKNLDEASNLIEEKLKRNISFLSEKNRIFIDLTGGFDGRLICLLLKEKNLKFSAGICGEQISNEKLIADQVANLINIEFHKEYRINNIEEFYKTILLHKKISSGVPIMFHSTELINYYNRIKENHNIHITGFGGSQILSQWIKNLGILSKRCNEEALIDKLFPYLDIFRNQYITNKTYKKNLKEKIRKLLNEIDSNIFTNISSYLAIFTFTKWYHGLLINNHNCIIPFYSPYLEHEIIRLLIETSFKLKYNHKIQKKMITKMNIDVSRILTSHGYNANIDTVDANKLINLKIRDFARRIIYQYKPVREVYVKKKYKRDINRIAELDRKYWVEEINRLYSDKMDILQILDIDKKNRKVKEGMFGNKLKAKIIYLNDMLEKYNVKIT